ncbi:MAG: hypothetical protein OEY91_01915 [Nitrospirota bacterium]|nr:hypothetical protein [Nitrospirota bacterium]
MYAHSFRALWVGVVLAVWLAIVGVTWVQATPPENNPGQPFEKILNRLSQLETKIDNLAQQPEPLSQVISRGYENRDDDDTTHEISSTGPMIVHVCGELIGAEEGSRVRVAITKGAVTVKKEVSNAGVRDTDCLHVGAEANEVLTVFLGVGGSTELNTIVTVQSTPSAVIVINDL